MTSKPSKNHYDLIARYAKALGHPTRVGIMYFLAHNGPCCFGDIFEHLPIAKSTVSQHLKELRESGLIIGEDDPPKVRYCVNTDEWDCMRSLFANLFDMCGCKNPCCCDGHHN